MSQFVAVYCCWQWRSCCGELLQRTGFSLCLSLLLCIVAGSGGPAVVGCCSSTGFSLCLIWFPVHCTAYSRGPTGVSCCSSTGFSLCLSWLLVYCCWQWRSCWGELLQQYWIQLVSQLVACVLLLAVEVLLGRVAAAVLDSACVSVGCLCIVAGSRGPAGVSCCSSTGFSLCLSWFPVYCGWQ